MNELACPCCYWKTQIMGWHDADSPITKYVPMCFGVKEPGVCPYGGNAEDCPKMNKEAKRHEQRT